MKIRLLFTLAALAIGLPTPALAQLQNTVDPEVRQQAVTKRMEEAFKAKRMEEAFNKHDIEALTKRMEEAYNKHDAAAWSAFYTEFAIDVWYSSVEDAAVGLAAIKKRYEAYFASHPKPISIKVAQVYAIANANKIVAVIDYTHHLGAKGQALVVYVYVPDADDWKVRLNYQL